MEGLNHTSWERSGLEGYGRPQPYILERSGLEGYGRPQPYILERSGLEGYGRPQPYILVAKWFRRLWKASTIHLGSEVV